MKCTRDRSAPISCRRGTSVSAGSSSPLQIRTSPPSAHLPSGHSREADIKLEIPISAQFNEASHQGVLRKQSIAQLLEAVLSPPTLPSKLILTTVTLRQDVLAVKELLARTGQWSDDGCRQPQKVYAAIIPPCTSGGGRVSGRLQSQFHTSPTIALMAGSAVRPTLPDRSAVSVVLSLMR